MTTGRRLGIGFAAFAVLFVVAVVGTIRYLETQAWERINGHWENGLEAYRDYYAEQALAKGCRWDEADLRAFAVPRLPEVVHPSAPPRPRPEVLERDLWGGRWRRSRRIVLSRLPSTWVSSEPIGIGVLTLEARRNWFVTKIRAMALIYDLDAVDPLWTEKLRNLFQEVGIDLEMRSG